MLTPSEQILEKLIAFPTVSQTPNRELIQYVQDYLSTFGVESVRVPDGDAKNTNLYARIGPDRVGGVLLSGHTDVVPTDGQDWARDAFRMTLESGRLYGRGTADMKGFLACVLALVPEAVTRNLRVPLYLAFSYDEEIGCVGVRQMLDRLAGSLASPDCCIIGEPTRMEVGIAHKGKWAGVCTCRGVEAHSALTHRGLNAIYLAMEMIQAVRGLQQEIISHNRQDLDSQVPWTTLQVGTIQGGTALNIIPGTCHFALEIRYTRHDDPEELVRRLRQAANRIVSGYQEDFPAADIQVRETNQYPGLHTNPEEEVVWRVQDLVGTDRWVQLSFGTEGGLFQQRLGVPTVICGPGSMDQGHQPDEFILRTELAKCDVFLGKLLDQISDP